MELRESMKKYEKSLATRDIISFMCLGSDKKPIRKLVEQWINKVESDHKNSTLLKDLFPFFRESIKNDMVITNFLFFMLLVIDPKLENTFFEEDKSLVHPVTWSNFMIDLVNETDRLFKGDRGYCNQYSNIENFVNHIITMYTEFRKIT